MEGKLKSMTKTGNSAQLAVIHAGFIPLVDSAPLFVARELGFDTANGLELQLHRDVSWANIRDKVNVGHLDCAQMLAPMPVAASLGINHIREAVIAPMVLSLNGNAITVSRALHAHMLDISASETRAGGMQAGHALAKVTTERRQKKNAPAQLTFGIVYPFSCQNYELHHWLTAAGLHIGEDIRLVGLPPQMMPESLAAGQIDGYCAGEPWNSAAVTAKTGCIVATKEELWGRAPEKVLGVRLSWAERRTDDLMKLIRALRQAIDWLAVPDNHRQAAEILSKDRYLGQSAELLMNILSGHVVKEFGRAADSRPQFLHFGNVATHRPSRNHTAWILAMMYQTGQIDKDADYSFVLDQVARADLYDRAFSTAELVDEEELEANIAQTAGFGDADPITFINGVRKALT